MVDVESVVNLRPSLTKISPLTLDGTKPTEPAHSKDNAATKEETAQPAQSEGEERRKEVAELIEGGQQSSPVVSEEQLRESEGEKEHAERIVKLEVTKEDNAKEGETKEQKASEKGVMAASLEVASAQGESVVIIDSEDSGMELTKILLEAFRR